MKYTLKQFSLSQMLVKKTRCVKKIYEECMSYNLER